MSRDTRPERSAALLSLVLALSTAGCGDDAAAPVGAAAARCPPDEAPAVEVGSVVPDVQLMTCAGAERTLWELCPNKAALVYSFALWCDSCQTFAASGVPTDWSERYGADGFELWFVVTSDASGLAPEATDCQAVAAEFALPFPVLYDPHGLTASTLGMPPNAASLVLTEGAVIHSMTNRGPDPVAAALQEIFGF